eukprot:11660546-Ditylum_brightwellii.AAC.1
MDIVPRLAVLREERERDANLKAYKELNPIFNDFHDGLINASNFMTPYPLHWWTPTIKNNIRFVNTGKQKYLSNDAEQWNKMHWNIYKQKWMKMWTLTKEKKIGACMANYRRQTRNSEKARSDSLKDRHAR